MHRSWPVKLGKLRRSTQLGCSAVSASACTGAAERVAPTCLLWTERTQQLAGGCCRCSAPTLRRKLARSTRFETAALSLSASQLDRQSLPASWEGGVRTPSNLWLAASPIHGDGSPQPMLRASRAASQPTPQGASSVLSFYPFTMRFRYSHLVIRSTIALRLKEHLSHEECHCLHQLPQLLGHGSSRLSA